MDANLLQNVGGTTRYETNKVRNLKIKKWGDMAYYIPTV